MVGRATSCGAHWARLGEPGGAGAGHLSLPNSEGLVEMTILIATNSSMFIYK